MPNKNLLIGLGVLGGLAVLYFFTRKDPNAPRTPFRSEAEVQKMLKTPEGAKIIKAELQRTVKGRG